jgi:hypothetical protein
MTIVTSHSELRKLAKAGLIVFPVTTNWNPNTKPFTYVDEVGGVGMSFTHKKIKYRMKYHSGCFYPYLYTEN